MTSRVIADSQKVNVADVSLAYTIHGGVRGPWIVMSSSLGTDHRMWQRQLPALVEAYRVLVYDHRGHGESTAGDRDTVWTMDLLVADVVGLMDALDIGTAAFVGLSLGGALGLGLALAHPERLSRLVCCSARADAPEAYRDLWRDRARSVSRDGITSVVGPTLERWFTDDAHRLRPEVVAEATAMLTATSPEGYIGAATALTTLDYFDRLGGIDVPTLFLAGERDAAISPDVMRGMSEKTPGSRFVSIADAAHLTNMERPAAFNEELATWLKSA